MTTLASRLRAAGPTVLLRAFLGVTFTFAGLQKLANPNFFNASSPTSFQAQIHGAMGASPIAPVLRLTLHAAVPIAVIIAVGEVLVGLGTLVGFLSRIAAIGGALLSLSFFLSISYGTSPYYYGSDIVFFFAWTVLIFGGAGPLSLDAVISSAPATAASETSAGTSVPRRTVLGRGVVTAAGLVATGALIGADVAIGRAGNHPSTALAPGTPTSSSAPSSTGGNSGTGSGGASETTTTGASAGSSGSSSGAANRGERIAATDAIAVGSALAFTDPTSGPAFVVHGRSDAYVGFSAICTHAGCTVNFDASSEQFICPCHGSIYNGATGAVENGPALLPLPSIPLEIAGGEIYLKGS